MIDFFRKYNRGIILYLGSFFLSLIFEYQLTILSEFLFIGNTTLFIIVGSYVVPIILAFLLSFFKAHNIINKGFSILLDVSYVLFYALLFASIGLYVNKFFLLLIVVFLFFIKETIPILFDEYED